MLQEVQGSGYLSKAADLYSLGVLLWELYHGMPPYASSEGRLVNNQCFPRFNLRSRQDAPFSYAVLTLACLSKEHSERCAPPSHPLDPCDMDRRCGPVFVALATALLARVRGCAPRHKRHAQVVEGLQSHTLCRVLGQTRGVTIHAR